MAETGQTVRLDNRVYKDIPVYGVSCKVREMEDGDFGWISADQMLIDKNFLCWLPLDLDVRSYMSPHSNPKVRVEKQDGLYFLDFTHSEYDRWEAFIRLTVPVVPICHILFNPDNIPQVQTDYSINNPQVSNVLGGRTSWWKPFIGGAKTK